jgi:lactoylglutathione lyase
MKPKIALITIMTDNAPAMFRFYRDVMGFQPQGEINEDNPDYAEFESEGVRLAICARAIMMRTTGHASFQEPASGQAFELAFLCATPGEVDATYAEIVAQDATPVKPPSTMPWSQYTAFFADPDGNIHELFADLPKEE